MIPTGMISKNLSFLVNDSGWPLKGTGLQSHHWLEQNAKQR